MPVQCEVGASVIDASGDVAYWGAPLTWGCTDSSCMDADDDCTTVDYKYVEYRIDSNNQLLRRVLDVGFNVIREEIFAQNITDLQAVMSGDQNAITLTFTVLKNTALNRQISTTSSINVYLRNRG